MAVWFADSTEADAFAASRRLNRDVQKPLAVYAAVPSVVLKQYVYSRQNNVNNNVLICVVNT